LYRSWSLLSSVSGPPAGLSYVVGALLVPTWSYAAAEDPSYFIAVLSDARIDVGLILVWTRSVIHVGYLTHTQLSPLLAVTDSARHKR